MNTRAFSTVRFWSAVALVIGLFLPWMTIGGFMTMAGYQFADLVRHDASAKNEQIWGDRFHPRHDARRDAEQLNATLQLTASYLIYCGPAVAALCIALELSGKRPKVGYLLAAATVLGALGILYKTENTDVVQSASVGVFVTIAGAIGMVIGVFIPSRSQPASGGASGATRAPGDTVSGSTAARG